MLHQATGGVGAVSGKLPIPVFADSRVGLGVGVAFDGNFVRQLAQFLREGDQLYDGRVEKIAMDGVSFHETGKDAFGKPVERQVNKRIYSSPGEQQ